MAQPINSFYAVNPAEHPQTPLKDLPPSLGFGSSSSPIFESPATVSRNDRFFQWSPQQLQPKSGSSSIQFSRSDVKSSPFLLPSQFPPASYPNLGSSPPDAHRTTMDGNDFYAGSSLGSGLDPGASPKPNSQRRRNSIKKKVNTKSGQRGRPRKYILEETHYRLRAPTDSTNEGQEHHARLPASRSLNTRKRQSDYQHEIESAKRAKPVQSTPRIPQVSVYTDVPTSNGVPLFSAKAFELACAHQLPTSRNPDIKSVFPEYEKMRSQFSTNGLGFNFSINVNGRASMDTTQQTPISPNSIQQSSVLKDIVQKKTTPTIVQCLLEEDSDSESEAESEATISPVRTPPRFSSLGHCDAATAFAKSLARTYDRGLAFLFPHESTPDKHAHLSSFKPCTPRTPRVVPLQFDENLLSMQMHTPPGAIFTSYEQPTGNFATGMTPYIPSARTIELN